MRTFIIDGKIYDVDTGEAVKQHQIISRLSITTLHSDGTDSTMIGTISSSHSDGTTTMKIGNSFDTNGKTVFIK